MLKFEIQRKKYLIFWSWYHFNAKTSLSYADCVWMFTRWFHLAPMCTSVLLFFLYSVSTANASWMLACNWLALPGGELAPVRKSSWSVVAVSWPIPSNQIVSFTPYSQYLWYELTKLNQKEASLLSISSDWKPWRSFLIGSFGNLKPSRRACSTKRFLPLIYKETGWSICCLKGRTTKSRWPPCWDHTETSAEEFKARGKPCGNVVKTTFKFFPHNIEGGSFFNHNFTVYTQL